MRIGWIVYRDEDDTRPQFYTEEPPGYCYKVTKVVYAEVIE